MMITAVSESRRARVAEAPPATQTFPNHNLKLVVGNRRMPLQSMQDGGSDLGVEFSGREYLEQSVVVSENLICCQGKKDTAPWIKAFVAVLGSYAGGKRPALLP
jgi:hypothetical protein